MKEKKVNQMQLCPFISIVYIFAQHTQHYVLKVELNLLLLETFLCPGE